MKGQWAKQEREGDLRRKLEEEQERARIAQKSYEDTSKEDFCPLKSILSHLSRLSLGVY